MKYRERTEGLLVSVEPSFLGTRVTPQGLRYVWAYEVTLENFSEDRLQLINRHWDITDALGLTETVDGEGVVGQQPTLPPFSRFSYRSHCPLATPSGFMGGYYEILRCDQGSRFRARIPTFSLDSPDARPTLN